MSDDMETVPVAGSEKPPVVLMEVGGLIDESRVTVAVYGEDLEPERVTELLGVAPTSAHRKGERRGHRSPPYKKGAWFLGSEAASPIGPEALIRGLLAKLPPADSPVWAELRSQFELQLRFGLFLTGWNRGFGLSPEVVEQLGRIGLRFEFDIYANGDDDD